MRVTQGMMNRQMLTNLTHNNERLSTLQNVLASGKKINSPSDDPVGVGYALRYQAYISHNEQYQKNADGATSFLDFTDTTLSQINDVLQRARELAVRGANDTMAQQDRNAIASEVDQLFDQTVQLANTQFNGKYIFNGQNTEQIPYTGNTPWNANVDTGSINYPLSDGVTIPVNITGDKVIGTSADADNALKVLNDLSNSLKIGDTTGINNALANLTTRLDKLQEARADVGARSNRVDLIKNRLDDMNTNFQSLLSTTEDADIAKTITDLKMAENVQNASLAAGARVIQQTLVDFLR